MAELVPFKEAVTDRRLAAQFNARRPNKDLRFAAERQFALEIIRDNKALQACRPETIRAAMLDQAVTGLSLSPALQHAYLIPWGDVATFSPSYRGLVHLCVAAGTIKSIASAVVHENDKFDYFWDESGPRLLHNPARQNRGRETHAWCLAQFTNGDKHLEVMEWTEVLECKRAAERLYERKRAKGGEAPVTPPAWKYWPHQQARKCCIRRGWKFWPLDDSGQIRAAMEAMNQVEPVDFGDTEKASDEPQTVVLSESDIEALDAYCRSLGVSDPGKWLSGLSQALGYESIEQVPSAKYDECVRRIKTRWETLQEAGP